MATTVWRGQLTFALVSFPVRLFRAARAEKIHFRRLQRSAAPAKPAPRRLSAVREIEVQEPEPEPVIPTRNAVVSRDQDEPVPSAELVRGYEVEKGTYAVVEEDELRSLAPETSKEIQVVEFVRLAEVDPIYFETSYYVRPDEAGERPYALLFEAMRKSGYVALSELAMHRREHVVILRPGNTSIIAHTMFYPDEVRQSEEFRADTAGIQKRELDLATKLINTMVVPFEPAKFRDTYRERLQELIESKTPAAAVKKPATQAVDIMAALQKSLNQKRKKAG